MTVTSVYVDDARGYAQGGIFLMRGEPESLDALVFHTTGLNQCPPEFMAKTLDRDLILDTNGLAHIVADDLENMYQGRTGLVANFDPWD